MRYHQHCPVAAATEVVGDTWTLLVVRELLHGNTTPTAIAASLPGISASLLARRIKTLIEAGVVTRVSATVFELTPAGRELGPVLDQLGHWSRRWTPPPRPADLRPGLLLHDICRGIDRDRLPERPAVVHFRFSETPPPLWWWLLLSRDDAAVTATDPRLAEPVRVDCTLSALARIWLGHKTWLDGLHDHTVRLSGTRDAVRAAIGWLGRSRFSPDEQTDGTRNSELTQALH